MRFVYCGAFWTTWLFGTDGGADRDSDAYAESEPDPDMPGHNSENRAQPGSQCDAPSGMFLFVGHTLSPTLRPEPHFALRSLRSRDGRIRPSPHEPCHTSS